MSQGGDSSDVQSRPSPQRRPCCLPESPLWSRGRASCDPAGVSKATVAVETAAVKEEKKINTRLRIRDKLVGICLSIFWSQDLISCFCVLSSASGRENVTVLGAGRGTGSPLKVLCPG